MPSRGFASNYRVALLVMAVLLCFAGVGARLVRLHVTDRDLYLPAVEKSRQQSSKMPARRGDILDSRGDILATSNTVFDIGVNPQALLVRHGKKKVTAENRIKNGADPAKFSFADGHQFPALARLLGMDEARLGAALNPAATKPDGKAVQWVKLAKEIPGNIHDEIMALNIRGVEAIGLPRRVYPHNQLAAHIIGFINKEGVAASGVEAYFNKELSGYDGWRESEKDGHRHELAQFRRRDVPPTNGWSIVLSLDTVVQSWAEEGLAAIAREFNPHHATIIVSEAQSGFLLAMANYPTFNLNEFSKAPMEVLKNNAVASQLEPGSTFKIVATSAALNERLVSPGTRFDCSSGVATHNGRSLRLMPDDHASDHPLTVAEIISRSSNRGASLLAMRLGDKRFYDYARAFGFGARTGFPFGGEISGMLNPPAKWSGIDITRIPAGYSVSATPLQIHCAMAAIASGGELLRPQIVREIRDDSGAVARRFERESVRRVLSPDVAEQMAFMLQGVASRGGTADVAEIPGYQVAGKTGTAQKIIGGRYSKKNHVGSFVGFLPAGNPRVVITIIVDDGRTPANTAGYGSKVAAPGFKHLAEKLIPYLDIKPAAAPDARQAFAAHGGPRP
ncbi:MAG: penicillin-binding protein 2 [Opitutaceae bacterium]|jgi:cell division protein FtsI (penicillin-binding protein 3)/stage V sporulation protein D (sporulation-specific penicillin-binding protein)|nr:penicillin-binding protein 2 [Opitutaceae bacterium]